MSTVLDPLKAALPSLPPSTADAAAAAEFARHPTADDDADALVADLAEDPGLNPAHVRTGGRYQDSADEHSDDDDGDGGGGGGDTSPRRDKARRLARAVAHPVRVLKDHSNRKAAARVAAARPVVPRANDREFLRAARRVERRDGADEDDEDEDGDEDEDEDEEQQQAGDVERLNELVGERDSLRVAWTVDEGVMRAVVVDRRPRALPAVKEFERVDGDGNDEVRWEEFVGTCLLNASWPYTSPYVDQFGQVPFEADMLRRHVHRLLLCSAPVQKWIVNVRAVYRWEDAYCTLGWAVFYAFLVGIDRVATFFLGWILWHVVRNGMHPSRPSESTSAIERKLDSNATPATVAELIDQCDQTDWFFPLLDLLGPIIQLQVSDASDLLEILDNFYQWKNPMATIRTTCVFAGSLVAFNVFSAAFLLRCAWVVLGLVFFGLWPIASRHPQYRLLVSPARWAFWGVPTHAEWGLAQLQLHGARVLRGLRGLREKAAHGRQAGCAPHGAGPAGPPLVDLASFGCVLHAPPARRRPGRLVVSTAGVRFQGVGMGMGMGKAHEPDTAAFDIPYARLVEVCKKQARAKQALPENVATGLLKSMEITYDEQDDGEVAGRNRVVLANLRGRDRAFNLILAFSGLEWKSLQPYTDE